MLCILAVSSVVGVPALAQEWTTDAMFNTKQVNDVQVSPDGKRTLIAAQELHVEESRKFYVSVIYLVENSTGELIQLTRGQKSSTSPRWSPDGKLIAFLSDRSGSHNIWILRLEGGEAWQLTAVAEVGGFQWSPAGNEVAFAALDLSKKRPVSGKSRVAGEGAPTFQLWTVRLDPLHSDPPRRLTDGAYSVTFGVLGDFNWSPSGDRIVFSHIPTASLNDWPKLDLSVVDVKGGQVRPLAATAAAETSPIYSPDRRWIAYLASDDPPTWGQDFIVRVMPVDGGPVRTLAATYDHLPRLLGWSQDSAEVFVAEGLRTGVALYALPLNGGPPRILQKSGLDEYANSINSTGTWIGFVCQSSSDPPEACISRLDRFAPVKVSNLNGHPAKGRLPRTEVVQWKSADGEAIEGLLTYPLGYQEGRRYPLLVILHGGPVGACLETYAASSAFYPVTIFAAHGYAVLRPNFRGSSGYGRAFRYGSLGDWGGRDYDDVMAGVDRAIELGVADGQRLGIMGWSYGGYLASHAITRTSRFKAASIGAAAADLISHGATTDLPAFITAYLGGPFWDRWNEYHERSPLSHVKEVTTPLLIQHGENDTRVAVSQAYELYYALRQLGRTVKLTTYPGMAHNPWEPDAIAELARGNLEWFDKYLQEGSLENAAESHPSSQAVTRPAH